MITLDKMALEVTPLTLENDLLRERRGRGSQFGGKGRREHLFQGVCLGWRCRHQKNPNYKRVKHVPHVEPVYSKSRPGRAMLLN